MRQTDDVLEDYLVTIFRLEQIYGKAKTTLIASELGVTPATVTKVLEHLMEKKLIKRDRYKGAVLTDKGLEIAKKVIRKHRIVEIFLRDELGFDFVESHYYAHYMEHLPDIIIERIEKKFVNNGNCPHGNPLKMEKELDILRLSDTSIGKCYEITRIIGELKFVFSELIIKDIHINDIIFIIDKTENEIMIRSIKNNKNVSLRMDIARAIGVKENFCR